VSASEPAAPRSELLASYLSISRRLRRLAVVSWSTLRQSRLGVLGFSIVLVFALMAVLAGVIAPYPRLFEAPIIDRFDIHAYSHQLPGNQTYSGPVLGPTTPLLPDAGGGEWIINWNETHATVYMNFLKYAGQANQTPFATEARSLQFDATQKFGVSPLPSPPLTDLYWIVPGKNLSFQTGPRTENGALAYFMGRDFIVGDPFTDTLIFHMRLPFDPVWNGEDPESGGYLVSQPTQNGKSPFPGVPATPFGPYRYFYASNGTETIVFEITYVHTNDATPGISASGRIALWSNETLSAPPFVYSYWARVTDDDDSGFRSGPGQAILLPLANNSLAVYNVSGNLRALVPLNLFGRPASVVAPIGYSRSPDTATFFTYLQLRSDNATAIATFDMGRLQIAHVFPLPQASLQLIETPISYEGAALYLGFNDPATQSTLFLGLDMNPARGNLTAIPQFRLSLPGRVRNYFAVPNLSGLYVFAEGGKLLRVPTTFVTGGAIQTEDFGLTIPEGVRAIVYAGSFHGTLYSVALSPEEVNGAWTDSTTGKTTVFTLLGKTRAPLAPGTYPSGNSYLLGTDFNGHDIFTELLYGTQVAFIVGILAALFGVGIGTFVGVVAGYYGKTIDSLLMRTTDIFLVLPFLPIVLVLVAIARPSIWIIIFVLAILTWPGIARVIRAQVLSLRERPFVDAARVAGASDTRLIFLHITPNVLPFSLLYMSLGVAGAIITEAALSYLGLGDPNVTSWGGMLSTLITLGGGLYYWWWLLPPGLSITLLSLGFYLLGRGFDEIINPRLRRR
jgi:peptide/nickel transport system permease protein